MGLFPNICIWTATSLAGNYESYVVYYLKEINSFGFTGVQTLQTIYLVYLQNFVFKKSQNFQRIKSVRHSEFSLLASEPIRIDENGGKFRKPTFSGKRISEMLFHGSDLILQLQNFQMLYLDRDFFSRKQ